MHYVMVSFLLRFVTVLASGQKLFFDSTLKSAITLAERALSFKDFFGKTVKQKE